MDMLIGFVTGLWIVLTAVSMGLFIKEVLDSNLESATKFGINLWLVIGNVYVISTILEWSLLLVDKL